MEDSQGLGTNGALISTGRLLGATDFLPAIVIGVAIEAKQTINMCPIIEPYWIRDDPVVAASWAAEGKAVTGSVAVFITFDYRIFLLLSNFTFHLLLYVIYYTNQIFPTPFLSFSLPQVFSLEDHL